MGLPRVLVDGDFEEAETLTLPAGAQRHLIQVLRLTAGKHFIVFNGREPREALAELEQVSKKLAIARILEVYDVYRESPLDLTLVQSICASERMDFALQKSVELGVKKIVPVFSERSQRRMKPAQVEKKMRHWLGVITHASEQSGRCLLPSLFTPTLLSDYLAERKGNAIGFAPESDRALKTLPAPQQPLDIIVGPEGGFSAAEVKMMQFHGIPLFNLGPRILRTETAGIAVLGWLQIQWGDA